MSRVLNIRDLGAYAGAVSVTGKGRRWRMGVWPDDVRRIDRRTPYGNPYRIGDCGPNNERLTREQSIALFRLYATAKLEAEPDWLEPLRSKRLACWCAPLACHGDVIAELIP